MLIADDFKTIKESLGNLGQPSADPVPAPLGMCAFRHKLNKAFECNISAGFLAADKLHEVLDNFFPGTSSST